MKQLKSQGLIVIAALAVMASVATASASATTLKLGSVTQSTQVSVVATLEAGTSMLLKDGSGTTADTCSSSEIKGSTSSSSGVSVTAAVSVLSFTGCTHTTKVTSRGTLHIEWINGTDQGLLISSGAAFTYVSTAFGISTTCETATGTVLGTLTGKTGTSEHATIDINSKVLCPGFGTVTWTASYIVTSPTGLSVTS
ncbi:MAG TPA: hypothetical protein VFN18_07930 [Solirubrobacterales bacterium]|nr:hypothetical protein [Solirubrobacterales bacterium]